MIKVKLSKTELEMATLHGKLRYRECRLHGQEYIQDRNADSMHISIIGSITEYAVAKYLNVFFDMNCDMRYPFPPDLISKSGNTIDVKCTTKRGGHLNSVIRSVHKPADIYILTEYKEPIIYIVGWVERQKFLIDSNIRDVGNGPYYCMPQARLNKFP